MAPVTLGISGARRNAAAALCVDRSLVAACEQERIVRLRGVGLVDGAPPAEAIDAVLAVAGRTRADIAAYAAAESEVRIPNGAPLVRLDHHEGHAATAFLTSPFDAAAILVCDEHATPATTIWTGRGVTLSRAGWMVGPGLAALYSAAAAALGFERREHELEALAALGEPTCVERLRHLLAYRDGVIHASPGFNALLAEWAASLGRAPSRVADLATSLQERVGELLLEIARDVRRNTGETALCLAGGLFYNTYLTTRVATSGLFERVFVPDNPGNAGLAVGAALAAACAGNGAHRPDAASSFLGPSYSSADVKHTLDNCKLSYSYLTEREVDEQVVEALARGHLVGWFDGRMEWGHRALGHRSILASPLSPYALENLNGFLKHRQPWRRYGLSVCLEDCATLFDGPPASRAMEYEYGLRDPERFRAVLPAGAARVRVHTVSPASERFARLLRAFGARCGVPALVNTSFNGLHEPIVCSPRDAVRVFYGTGLDLLAIDRFLLRK